jgi:hypothetical protein
MSSVTLSSQQLHELADLIADRLAARQADELLDANELAKRINRSRDYVYEHATALGALRLGDGPRPRLMFPWPLRQVEGEAAIEKPVTTASNRRRQRVATPLLPIKGPAAPKPIAADSADREAA